MNTKGQAVGSKETHYYESIPDPHEITKDEKEKKLQELEEVIEEYRIRGRLWNTDEEDPEVANTLQTYDDLAAEVRMINDPLDFTDEDWSEDEED
jgi:hypothetical protein